jgi:O-antigen/teichoic acid export membrane protein
MVAALAVVYLARAVGPETFGLLSVGISLAVLASYMSDLGITHLTLRHVAHGSQSMSVIFTTVLKARLMLLAIVCGSVWLLISVSYPNEAEKQLLLILLIPSVVGLTLQGFSASYFLARRELHKSALLKAATQVCLSLTIITVCFKSMPTEYIAAAYGACTLIGGLVSLAVVRESISLSTKWDPILLKELGAYTVAGVSGLAMMQLGPYLLERVAGAAEAGYFSAAYRIPLVLLLIPNAINLAFYPQLFVDGANDHNQHSSRCIEQLHIVLLAATICAVPLLIYAEPVIQALFGSTWIHSGSPALRLLTITVMTSSISSLFADALTTSNQQRRRAAAALISTVIGIVALLTIGSSGGARGGAIALVGSQTICAALMIMWNPRGRYIFVSGAREAAGALTRSLGVAVLLYLFLPTNIISLIICAVLMSAAAIGPDKALRGSILAHVSEVIGLFRSKPVSPC